MALITTHYFQQKLVKIKLNNTKAHTIIMIIGQKVKWD